MYQSDYALLHFLQNKNLTAETFLDCKIYLNINVLPKIQMTYGISFDNITCLVYLIIEFLYHD